MDNFLTRQLPIGAGHCQWGGFTDRNVCNIHGEAPGIMLSPDKTNKNPSECFPREAISTKAISTIFFCIYQIQIPGDSSF